MKNTSVLNPFITGSSHTQLSKSSTIGRKLVRSRQEWNIQLLRRIIVKLVMNLARPRCLRAICCWVCSYLWAHRSWCAFTMPPHQEEGDRRGFTRQGGERMRWKIKQFGGGDEALSGKYLKILRTGLWNFMARIGSWLQRGKKKTQKQRQLNEQRNKMGNELNIVHFAQSVTTILRHNSSVNVWKQHGSNSAGVRKTTLRTKVCHFTKKL